VAESAFIAVSGKASAAWSSACGSTWTRSRSWKRRRAIRLRPAQPLHGHEDVSSTIHVSQPPTRAGVPVTEFAFGVLV